MEIKDILEQLLNLRNYMELEISDNCLFENAIKLHISQNINESKKENIRDMKENRNILNPVHKVVQNGLKHEFNPITSKQLSFLKKAGYNGNLNINTKQASLLIKSYIEGGK
jgi:hypothetical protein